MSTAGRSDLQLENEHFRVTKWTTDARPTIPRHRHDHEYVVIPLVTARMQVELPDGTTLASELRAGEGHTRPAGSEHAISNRFSDVPIVFVEVERIG